MVASFIDELIKKITMDPHTIAVLIQAALGLSISVLIGQVVAFAKYINLNEPIYQIFSFVMTKAYSFVMSSIKYLGVCLLAYFVLRLTGFFMKTNFLENNVSQIYLAYTLFAMVSFGFGFSKERTRSLSENMMTKAT